MTFVGNGMQYHPLVASDTWLRRHRGCCQVPVGHDCWNPICWLIARELSSNYRALLTCFKWAVLFHGLFIRVFRNAFLGNCLVDNFRQPCSTHYILSGWRRCRAMGRWSWLIVVVIRPSNAQCTDIFISKCRTFSLRTLILLLASVILAPNRKYTRRPFSQKMPVAPLCEWINRRAKRLNCLGFSVLHHLCCWWVGVLSMFCNCNVSMFCN